jgi:hypothetical protein
MIKPSTPVLLTTSAMSRNCCSPRSGPTLASTGGSREPSGAARLRASSTRTTSASISARACSARSPGVFGEERLTTM